MILVTGCNQGYYNRIRGYLHSLEQYADFPVNLVTVGFSANPNIKNVTPFFIDPADNYGAPPQTESIQHGSFLKVIKYKPKEVIVYTDGDFVMQRPLDLEEKKLLKLKDGEVITSWNGGPNETLEIEASRLNMRCDINQLINDWGNVVKTAPIYNVGFLGMTANTWGSLYENYIADWNSIALYFGHMARQQWLISYTIAQLGLTVKIAPWSLHAHGHFGLKPGMERRPDGIYHDGKLAAFRHYL